MDAVNPISWTPSAGCWGEQNPRLLRADKMADLIWAGSTSRKATSFAEASLIFTDAENLLPMNFHEVSITRRLYRTGESEYLINKTPCRLKDIENLFMDTGLGPHAYSIMEQGKIDQLLQMKPEQRRFIFEEAAGITKYQTRKEEALRKLTRTEENLLRLNDIIVEVKRQVNSVERQARAAKRYQEFETELQKLEVSFSKKEYDRLQEMHQALSEKLTLTREKSTALQNQINQSEQEYETHRQRGVEIEQHLSQQRQDKFNTESQVEKIDAQIQISQSTITSSRETLQVLESELTTLHERQVGLQEQKQQKETALNASRSQITSQKEIIASHQSELNQTVTNQRQTENNIQQAQNNLRQKNERSAKLQNELGGISANLQSITTRQTEVLQNLSEKEKAALDLKSTVDAAQLKVLGFDTSIQASKVKVNQINQQINENKEQKNQLSRQLDVVKAERANKQSRRSTLLALKESFEGYQSGTKSVLQGRKSKQAECDGIKATVAELVSTSSDYEIAIEASLGIALNYLVTTTAEDARKSLDWLKQTNKGSATIFSLDIVPEAQNLDLPEGIKNADGYIGIASSLVKYDAAYRNIIETLLGKVIIAKDLNSALHIIRQYRGAWDIVTLQGERISGQGAISGGSVKTPGLLAQDREIQELAGKLQQLEKDIQQVVDQMTSCDQKLTELEQQRSNEQTAGHEFEIQRAQAQRDVESLTAQSKNITREIDLLNVVQTNSVKDAQNALNRQQQLQQELKQIEEELLVTQQKIEEWIHAQVEIGLKRETQAQKITELQVELATLESNAQSVDNQLRQITGDLQKIINDIQQKKEQKQLNENRCKEAEELIVRSEETKKELRAKVETIITTLAQLETEKTQIEEKVNVLSRQLAEMRRDHAQVQNEFHELELQVHDFNWKIENLHQRILDTYHLDIKEPIDVGDVDLSDESAVNIRIAELKVKIQKIGPVNYGALQEFEESQKRYNELKTQEDDAKAAIASLRATVQHINSTTKQLFIDTFNAAQANFHEVFRRLFRGGNAKLVMLDEENPLECGIDIVVQPPGKNLQNISLLSGGEKALSAIALLFSIYFLKPSPVCILDEIDAPLDDVNIGRFTDMVKEMVDRSQFIVITHSKRTMEAADNLYGVTMEEAGVSKVVAVRITGETQYDAESLAGMEFGKKE